MIEGERGRLKMSDYLTNMWRSIFALSPQDLLPAVYLATNRLAPDAEGIDTVCVIIGGGIVGVVVAVGGVGGVVDNDVGDVDADIVLVVADGISFILWYMVILLMPLLQEWS